MRNNIYSISVVMPCFNEERNIKKAIESALRALDRFSIIGEVIVVNDGSTDNSLSEIESVAITDSRIGLIDKLGNEGIGNAFRDGVRKAKSISVVMVPGDNENDLSEMLTYYGLIKDVDIIVPFVHNVEVRDLKRRVISSTYRFIVNMTFGTLLNYTNGTVIYNREAINSINTSSSGFFYQTELLVKLIRKGYLYSEVPQLLGNRESGSSTALTLRSIIDLLGSFMRLVYEIHILRSETNIGHLSLPKSTATWKKYIPQEGGKDI